MTNMKNNTCQSCGKKFHACGSCGLLYEWQHRYCSDKCWFESGEKEHVQYLVENIFSDISTKNKRRFLELLNYIEDYDYLIEDYLNRKIKEDESKESEGSSTVDNE